MWFVVAGRNYQARLSGSKFPGGLAVAPTEARENVWLVLGPILPFGIGMGPDLRTGEIISPPGVWPNPPGWPKWTLVYWYLKTHTAGPFGLENWGTLANIWAGVLEQNPVR